MDVSPEHLVEQANERFQLQDYYGAIHLLEEVIATGRAFADAHHRLGLSYSLVGQPDKALEQLERALTLDPSLQDAYFGIGLYHYYAAVAPTAARVLRWLLLLPGGDRHSEQP